MTGDDDDDDEETFSKIKAQWFDDEMIDDA